MDELLKKLLAAEVLTEETKQELETAIKKHLEEAVSKAREDATAAVTAELQEQWITEREILIEALDAKVTEVLGEEINELKEDIERFRDLEAEYAEKLVETKAEMAEQLKKDVAQLIEKMDSFLELRLTAEIEELKEDLEAVRKQSFGKKVFEAFVEEFKKFYTEDDSVEAKLVETEQRLHDALVSLEETEKKIAKMERAQKMEQVLKPLANNARAKEIMEAILKNVDTPMLEDAYNVYIGRVLKESDKKSENTSEKEESVLAEGKKEEVNGVVKTGDNKEQLNEEEKLKAMEMRENNNKQRIINAEVERLRKIAGIA